MKLNLKVKWNQFVAWIKKNLPGWIKEAVDAGIQWLVPFLLKAGMSSLVSENRRVRYEAAKLPREEDE